MNTNQTPLIFDGHNDLLLRLHNMDAPDAHLQFLQGMEGGHLDLPRMRQGGFGGGFFAIYIPSDLKLSDLMAEMSKPQYDVPLPEEIPFKDALPIAVHMAAILLRIERDSKGAAKICHTAGDIRQCLSTNTIAMIMHIEGAEPVGEDFSGFEVLYAAGLRSIGPVWSRPTRFGHGVPFRYPSSPDTGPGLTDLGMELVKLCNQHNMVIDLAHLNEAGFWDVAKLSTSPLIATHANAHAICPHSRNLTDRQLSAIKDSGGIVGLNFATSVTRADGQSTSETSLDDMLRQIDHLIEVAGLDHVAFGSDFDGATISNKISDVGGLVHLRTAMRDHGYDENTMRKLCHENWLNALERVLGG